MTDAETDRENAIARIAESAESLPERLSRVRSLGGDGPELGAVETARLDRWREAVAVDKHHVFERRLEWDDILPSAVARALHSAPPGAGGGDPRPDWTRTLGSMVTFVASHYGSPEARPPARVALGGLKGPYPFQDFLWPFVEYAAAGLLRSHPGAIRRGAGGGLLSEEAFEALKGGLLQRLSKVFTHALYYELTEARPFGLNMLMVLDPGGVHPDEDGHYARFVQANLADGGLGLFSKYPALARCACTVVEFWVEGMSDLLSRLDDDLPLVARTFGGRGRSESDRPWVAAASVGLSDPHRRGREVVSLTLSSGVRVLYKPRDLAIEAAYNGFIEWCNGRSEARSRGLPPLKAVRVLTRDGYGWVEFVEQRGCDSEDEAASFFTRAGMLLALFHALGTTDCHSENLIAHGGHPVLVDTETVLHPETEALDETVPVTADLEASLFLEDSVLRSGLLPQWYYDRALGIVYDVSALSHPSEEERERDVSVWQNVNSDAMHTAMESMVRDLDANVPMLEGRPLSVSDFSADLLEGFRSMYEFLLDVREDALTSPDGLRRFESLDARFVFRPTNLYAAVIERSLEADALRSGVDRSIALEVLAQALITPLVKPKAWPLLEAELHALERLDVPYFEVNTSSDEVRSADTGVSTSGVLVRPSYEDAVERYRRLSSVDMDKQRTVIEAVLAASALQGHRRSAAPTPVPVPSGDVTDASLTDAALRIAEKIIGQSFASGTGETSWVGLSFLPDVERYQFNFLNDTLYDGQAGIALFFAACYEVTGERRYREAALQAVGRLTRRLRDTSNGEFATVARLIGPGGMLGLGSTVYALTRVAGMAEAPELVGDAAVAAGFLALVDTERSEDVAPAHPGGASHVDVMGGMAGGILGLLSLYGANGDEDLVSLARRFAAALLREQAETPFGGRAWASPLGPPLTGFSHGASGIAYSLTRLYGVTGNSELVRAAEDALDFERSVFSADVGNWPDFRFLQPGGDEREYMNSWCHGAPGVCLGRLGGGGIVWTPDIRAEVEAALTTVVDSPASDVDHVCCGNFGRIEAMIEASRVTDDPSLLRAARQWAGSLISQAGDDGKYALLPGSREVFTPGFFQGAAGIGYTLLRLSRPEDLTCVLTMS